MRGGEAMERLLRVLFLGLVVMAISTIGDARAQTPAPAQTPTPVPIVGNIYSVTYIEVMPTSKADAATLLRRYREAAQRKAAISAARSFSASTNRISSRSSRSGRTRRRSRRTAR